ncbi:MAG: hypothetical protein ACMUEK_02280 [Sodalis sp. (in: enterobacteria)]
MSLLADLAQEHTSKAYRHLAAGIMRLLAPCVWLFGNHDFKPTMRSEVLAEYGIIFPMEQVLIGTDW